MKPNRKIEPGMLCYVVRMPQPRAGLNGRAISLAQKPAQWDGSEWVWTLAKPLETACLCNCTQGGVTYWIGEVVVVRALQEQYLRPIQPGPGDDACLHDDTEPTTAEWLLGRMRSLSYGT